MSCYDKDYLFRTPILYNRNLSATEIVQAAIEKENLAAARAGEKAVPGIVQLLVGIVVLIAVLLGTAYLSKRMGL